MTGKMRWDKTHQLRHGSRSMQSEADNPTRLDRWANSILEAAASSGNPTGSDVSARGKLIKSGARPRRECEVCHVKLGITLCCRIGRKRDNSKRAIYFCNEHCRDAWAAANRSLPIWHQSVLGQSAGQTRKERRRSPMFKQ